MSKFSDLLNAPADSIEAPKDFPVGTWRWVINVVKLVEPKDEDTAGAFLFGFKPEEPSEDVDTEALAGFEIEDAQAWRRFRLRDKKDQYRLLKFLRNVGVETDGRSLEDAAKSCDGYSIMAYAENKPSYSDPDMTEINLTDFAPIS